MEPISANLNFVKEKMSLALWLSHKSMDGKMRSYGVPCCPMHEDFIKMMFFLISSFIFFLFSSLKRLIKLLP